MRDQAYQLRELMRNRKEALAELDPRGIGHRARSIVVTSGKGGVGKSNVAVNLGIALSQLNQSVCVLDANFGLGNVDLLCGLNGYWNLAHVMAGVRSLEDIILNGPGGMRVIPGADSLSGYSGRNQWAVPALLEQLQTLERMHDVILVDTGGGTPHMMRRIAAAADVVFVVTSPEATAMADAYAAIKAFSTAKVRNVQVLVNQAHSVRQGHALFERVKQTSRTYVRTEISLGGIIPLDECVPRAVAARKPFVLRDPDSPAAAAVRELARRVMEAGETDSSIHSFFAALAQAVTADMRALANYTPSGAVSGS